MGEIVERKISILVIKNLLVCLGIAACLVVWHRFRRFLGPEYLEFNDFLLIELALLIALCGFAPFLVWIIYKIENMCWPRLKNFSDLLYLFIGGGCALFIIGMMLSIGRDVVSDSLAPKWLRIGIPLVLFAIFSFYSDFCRSLSYPNCGFCPHCGGRLFHCGTKRVEGTSFYIEYVEYDMYKCKKCGKEFSGEGKGIYSV